MQQDFPSFLRWPPISTNNDDASEFHLMIHLECTYQEFLLYRIIWKRLGNKLQGLFESSCEVISTLLKIIMQRTKVGKEIQTLSWEVCLIFTSVLVHQIVIARIEKNLTSLQLCYMGIPSAGILVTQLQHPETFAQSPSYPHSWIIQKLSVFVSHLESVSDRGSVYGIFQQTSAIITDILDKILSNAAQSAGSQVNEIYDNNDLTFSDDDDIMQWVDTTRWDQHPWIDLSDLM